MNTVLQHAKSTYKARKAAKSDAAKTVRIAVVVCKPNSSALTSALKAALVPRTAHCKLFISAAQDTSTGAVVHTMADAVLIVAGDDSGAACDIYRAYRRRNTPCLLLVDLCGGADKARDLVAREVRNADIVITDSQALPQALGVWLLDNLQDFACVLAAGFSCCRDVSAKRLIGRCVRDNALVGALTFLKGADTPVMAASEISMSFKLAAMYDLDLNQKRLPEVCAIVGLSVVWKQLATHALLHVPLPASLIKGSIAAAATASVGTLLTIHYGRLAAHASASVSGADKQGRTHDSERHEQR